MASQTIGDAKSGKRLCAVGQLAQTRVATALNAVFPADPQGRRPAVHYWCRTMRCSDPACGKEIPLVRSRWLAKSERRKCWIEFHPGSNGISITVHTTGTPTTDPGVGTVRASSATCPSCSTSATANEVRAYGKNPGFGAQLYAVLEFEGKERRSTRAD